jgi:hypothetical protein
MKMLRSWNPAVNKVWLYLFAGVMWTGVGVMLIRFASRWLKPLQASSTLLIVPAGIALAFGIYSYGFARFADKNIKRISDYSNEQVCLFAFQAWTSYPLVAFMIALGIYLRLHSPFPKWVLAIIYLGIGGSLFLASFHYYACLFANLRAGKGSGGSPSEK